MESKGFLEGSIDKPIIAVCGATGFQGGSVVKHILQDGRFAIRALTRKPNGSRAKELIRAGATVVEANFDDLSSLCRAFEGMLLPTFLCFVSGVCDPSVPPGCYGAFGVTDYFDAFQKEVQQGNNIVEAAKLTGLKHLVISSAPGLADSNVESFKYKGMTYDYLQASGVPHTALIPVFYYGNIFLFDGLTKSRNGDWKLDFPFPTDIPIPSFSPKDTGAYALAAFVNPSEWLGKVMRTCSQFITPRQYAEIFSEVTGFNVEIQETTREQFMALEHEPYLIEGWSMFKWMVDEHERGYPYLSTELPEQLYPERQTWREFVTEHREAPVPQPLMIECFYTQERFRET